MSRRKYKDYKNDPTVKTPIIAWLTDRSIGYVVLAGFTILVLFVVYSRGIEALERINTEPVEISPYMSVNAVNSPGLSWAEGIIKEKPAAANAWAVAETTKPQNIATPTDVNITSEPVSTSVLSTYIGTGSGIETRVHVYGSGQSAKDFNRFVELLKDRTSVETATNDNGSSAKYTNGFFITMGDAIISVTAPNNEVRDELLKFYSTTMPETLKESGCLDLTITPNDANRSFFYDADSYTGLEKTTVVETQVQTNQLPKPSELTIDEIVNPDSPQPESPLPADFPTLPKNKVVKPDLPSPVEEQDDFKANAVYQIADENGPGCGWKWSGQVAPTYDLTKLSENENKTIVETQNEIDVTAQNYVDQKNDWAFQTLMIMPKLDNWNVYVRDTNKVHERWEWLNSERDKLKQPWETYVANYNNWLTFDQRKSDATNTYNDELKICVDKEDAVLEWDEKWGDLWAEQEAAKKNPPVNKPTTPAKPTTPVEEPETDEPTDTPEAPESPENTPTTPVEPTEPTEPDATGEPTPPEKPVDIPEKPEGCSALPEKPAIIDQAKPAEPKAPEIPEGVTIPDSWEKP